MQEDEEFRPDFTNEGIYYMRDLLRPFIVRLNTIQSDEELAQYLLTIPGTFHIKEDETLNFKKKSILDFIVGLLYYDRDDDEAGIQRDGENIDPWSIRHFINNNEYLRVFFNPPPIIIDVNLNGVLSQLELAKPIVYGIMVVYRYLHLPHPLSMYGFPLNNEAETVNEVALSDHPVDYEDVYNVNVGTDIYGFKEMNFFRGLITAAEWNNLDPHTFITNLKQWKLEPQDPTTSPRIPNIGEPFVEPRKYTVNLDY
ncbi:Hypothetical protein HVR_LOCUS541 [uncultured virus]|nr:Hypothetical protein HVR_LOCUS541 [uncultured virus]